MKSSHVHSQSIAPQSSSLTRHELNAEQSAMLTQALLKVDLRCRENLTPLLADWILRHSDLRFDKGIEKRIKALLEDYPNIDAEDRRLEKLARVSTHRYLCETGKSCAPSSLTDDLDDRSFLEVNIAYGFLALIWQVNKFPADIILTPRAMTQRYPLVEVNKRPAISPC